MQILWEKRNNKPATPKKSATLQTIRISRQEQKKRETFDGLRRVREKELISRGKKNSTFKLTLDLISMLDEVDLSDHIQHKELMEKTPISVIDSLHSNTNLLQLTLSMINVDSMASIAQGISGRKDVKLHIDLAFDKLLPQSLSRLLEPAYNIVSLNMMGTLPDEDVWQQLLVFLKNNTTLESLDLSNNELNDSHIFSLNEVLSAHPSLRRLSILENDLKASGVAALENLLQENKSIISLPGINTYKISILGNGLVGKTKIIDRFFNSAPSESVPTTSGTYQMNVEVDNNTYFLDVYDTSGSDNWNKLTADLIKNSHSYLLCFSAKAPDSLADIATVWNPLVEASAASPKKKLLVQIEGMSATEQISQAEIDAIVKQTSVIEYVKCDSEHQSSIQQLFQHAIEPYARIVHDNTEGEKEITRALSGIRHSLTRNYLASSVNGKLVSESIPEIQNNNNNNYNSKNIYPGTFLNPKNSDNGAKRMEIEKDNSTSLSPTTL
ncbi:MAG: GTP-binding protein [Gammaproteobacteria bacterium]|nr:GTP-binding protein [Gammaproteobacteria bacterium]